MAKIKRTRIFGKLNPAAYKSIESAALLCKARGNPYIEPVHWINQIIMGENTDFHHAIKYFGIDESKLAKDLTAYMDGLPRGSSGIEDFSGSVEQAVKEAWLATSLIYSQNAVRTGHLLLALKSSRELSSLLHDISREFIKINADVLQENFNAITEGSSETDLPSRGADTNDVNSATAPMGEAAMGNGEALKLYTVDMTEKAKAGESDPIVGRDAEIRMMIDILMRRRQNNPILTGESGVGKTAVAEGFAQRLSSGDVPASLKGTKLLSLDIGLLQAGAGVKGEFENRLKRVIEEVKTSDTPIILFIDEVHTLIGAGGAAGLNDAANLLKPALARGEVRCIAATTWREYMKYFEKDPALSRRFQNVLIDEPDDEKSAAMMRGIAKTLENHHKVEITDDALVSAVKLSRRYMPARHLPDKAVSVLDTACARAAVSRNSEPAELEYSRRRIESLEVEKEILTREEKEFPDRRKKLEELEKIIAAENNKKTELEKRFEKEKKLTGEYLNLVKEIREENEKGKTSEKIIAEIEAKRKELANIQGDSPMVISLVDSQAVAKIISEWTGIPIGKMAVSEIKSVLDLGYEMNKRVIGQKHGLNLIAKRVTTARASLADPNKPIAVFMLAGPSGVGKTETALALAEQLYGSETNMVTINMSEFQESHTVSTLKGAPPGYVGYGEGGVLTEAVRRKPYSVILLDEVEKAHKDVHEIFFQVFDKGRMEDGEGRSVNFRNTVIILTTNVGDEIIAKLCEDEEKTPDVKEIEKKLYPAMLSVFPAALLGRLSIIPYYPLSKESLNRIIDLKLEKIVKRVKENYNASLEFTQAAKDEIIHRCDNAASGARLIDAVINNDILPSISEKFLKNIMEGKTLQKAFTDVSNGKFTYSFENKEN